jgi:hypothetical protein
MLGREGFAFREDVPTLPPSADPVAAVRVAAEKLPVIRVLGVIRVTALNACAAQYKWF